MIDLYLDNKTTLSRLIVRFENTKKDFDLSYFCFDIGCSISSINLLTFNKLVNLFGELKCDGYINIQLADGKNIDKSPIYILPLLIIDNLYIINKRVIVLNNNSPNLIGNDIFSRLNYKVNNNLKRIEIDEIISKGIDYIDDTKTIVNFNAIVDEKGYVYNLNKN